jgi:hypothetical protein
MERKNGNRTRLAIRNPDSVPHEDEQDPANIVCISERQGI